MAERSPLAPGQRFGRLVVVEKTYSTIYDTVTRANYRCVCDCGNVKVASALSLKRGQTVSCGCKVREIGDRSRTHGKTGSREYWSWAGMLQRCNNPRSGKFPDYGGRGIVIEDGWEDFNKFFTDMGHCPEGFTLDREDVHGNYCKVNCRWVDNFVQSNNKRKSAANISGRTGVYFHKQSQKWNAELKVGGALYYAGRFKNFEDAVKAREQLELRHLGAIRTEEYEARPDLENS